MGFRQLRRPSRFTVRELLVLVASDLDHTEQREYVKQVFSWYFHREHVFLVAVSAGCVGLALATGQAANPIAVAVVFALLGALGFVVQIVLAPLHREYLCCLVLLQRLDRFREPLREAFEEEIGQPEPEPGTYLRFYGSWFTDGTTLAEAIRARHRQCRASFGIGVNPSSTSVGRYLFAVLAHVPTDEYERRRPVRMATDEVIRNASIT
jgi:hypothetical protein